MRYFIGVPRVGVPKRKFIGELAVGLFKGPRQPDPSSVLIFNAMSPPPSSARKVLIDQTVIALKNAGIWSKLDGLYGFAAHAEQPGRINWINPGTNTASNINVCTFAVDQGFTSIPTAYLDSNFNPSSAPSPKWVSANATLFAWANTDLNVGAALAGNTSNTVIIFPREAGNFNLRIHTSTENYTGASPTSVGFWTITRPNAGAMSGYKYGVPVTPASYSSAAVGVTTEIFFLRNAAATWNGQISWGGFGANLTATEVFELYRILNTYNAVLIGTYAPESHMIFNALTTPPTTVRKDQIDTYVKALKSGNVWDKLDGLYVWAAADQPTALINWKQPGVYTATTSGSPAFAPDVGFTGAIGKNVSSNFNPTTAPSPKFIRDSASQFGYALTETNTGYMIGISAGDAFISPREAGQFITRMNGPADLAIASASSIGFWATSRTGATAVSAYKDGSLIGSATTTSTPVVSNNLVFFQLGLDQFAAQVAVVGFGGGLNATEHLALYNATYAYLNSVGAFEPWQAESKAIFANMITPPTAARKAIIDQCVLALKTNSIWTKFDAFYTFAAADSQAARINWINPGTYNASEVNPPVAFTADAGFTGASTKYLDSTFNVSTAPAKKYNQNDAHLFGFSQTSADIAAGTMVGASSTRHWLNARGGGLMSLAVNGDGSGYNWAGSTDGYGLYTANRATAGAYTGYKNGASVALSVQTNSTSAVPTSENLWFLRTQSAYWTGQVAAGGFGSNLTAPDNLALYNAVANYLAGVQGGTIMSAEAIALFNDMGGTPTVARRIAINNCINALKTAGVWTKLDALYLFAAATANEARKNWKQPGTYNLTEIGSPTFTADRGYTGGASQYLDPVYNPTTSAPSAKWVQDSGSAFIWSLNNVPTGGAFGDGASARTVLNPRDGGGLFYGRVNTAAGDIVIANASAIGFYTVSRTAVNAVALYKDGVSQGTSTVSSSGTLSNAAVAFLVSQHPNYWAGGQMAAGGFGGGLSSVEQADLYNAILAYMTAIATDKIVASFTTPPTAARKTLIQNCVSVLIQNGVWDKLDGLYLLAAADSQAAIVNWKAPGTYNATAVSGPTFTADRGFTGVGAAYVDTSFNPTSAPTPKLTLNDASIFAWSNTAGSTGGSSGMICDANAAPRIRIYPQFSNSLSARLSSGADYGYANTDGTGLYSITRTSSTTLRQHKNGVMQLASADTSVGFQNNNIIFLSWLGQCSGGGFGSQLSDADHTILYNALRAYMTGVGVP